MTRLVIFAAAAAALAGTFSFGAEVSSGNRFTVLDDYANIYYPNHRYPKLTTPQWVGEEGVEAVLVLAIDDMRETARYETYLRPILERLKQIDGRAAASIMANRVDPKEARLQEWLEEGVSIEAHTVDHPCPILDGDFAKAKSTYDRCIDQLFEIPNAHPVGFRTPCMDGINSASPRLFAEIMMRTTENGNFLTISSSIGMLLTADDPENPRELVLDDSGKPRFNKYLLPGYINYIENYPYPYLVGNKFWEATFCAPDDYEGSRVYGNKGQGTVDDMKAAIDAVVAKKGIWVMTFHPYEWIDNKQVVELIDHVVSKHGKKAKFLNLPEVQERIDKNLLGGQSARAKDGSENGVRLLDLNNDGFLDVVIGNDALRQTRVWDAKEEEWHTSDFPARIVSNGGQEGVRFGLVNGGEPVAFVRNDKQEGAWRFRDGKWIGAPKLMSGLEIEGEKILSSREGRDRGVRFRDLNGDGATEMIVSNPEQNAIFTWTESEKNWNRFSFGLPEGTSVVTADGLDNGLRFVDLNNDGYDDVVFSNEKNFGVWLYVPKAFLGFKDGWSRHLFSGKRGDKPEIPMISRGGEFRNNGAWFARDHMWVQNEDTSKLPDLVARVPFSDLLNGLQPPALEPKEALKTIKVAPEFEVELVAHEPVVVDPVAMDWAADGTMWVVEMRDYPNGIDEKPGAVVKRLRDADADGFYESAEVFLDNLNFANGLMPWRNGVLISAAPDILFAEDTDGDGKADRVEKLFSGFVEGNQQHRMNGFVLGLDNWIYGANGDSGGTIQSVKTGARTPIGGRDFRFRPDTGEFQATSGQTQYGRRRDDWGNWFGGANYTWGWHYFLPEHYLARNPRLAVRTSRRPLNDSGDGTRVFPISRLQQRFNDIGMAGHVTSGCSFAPYRDGLFGEEFERSILICEPVHNLVHREVLEADGVSFSSKRSTSEQGREFLASTDPWFRPVNTKTGPDGAIYIADMYRLVIEHPEWIPDDFESRVDVRAGSDRGRIYRVRPKGVALRKPAELSRLQGGAELARALDTPNGWQRDTVHRLMLENWSDQAAPVLSELVRKAANAKVRLQALCVLDGMEMLDPQVLVEALKDRHPAVRENAVRISESWLRRGEVPVALRERLMELVDDPELRVRYQLALSLGEWRSPEAARVLATIAGKDLNEPDVITAVLSSASHAPAELAMEVLKSGSEGGQVERMVNHLAELVIEKRNREEIANFARALGTSGGPLPGWKLPAFAMLLDATKAPGALQIANVFERAREIVKDAGEADRNRIAAMRLLGRDESTIDRDIELLGLLLSPQAPMELQTAALKRLSQLESPAAIEVLFERWKTAGPKLRQSILAQTLRRESWAIELLERVRRGTVNVAELGASVRQELLNHPSRRIQSAAAEILKLPETGREELVISMTPRVAALKGDGERGRVLFETHCALCHKAGQAGTGAGPNLAMLYDNSVEQIVTALLDPNRAVEDKYRSYTVDLKDGEQASGILLNETGSSITIMAVNGAEQTILRRDIEKLGTSGRSLMPEGFEQFLQAQDFADVIAFMRASAAPPKVFAGNKPAVARAEDNGELRLTASRAEIYGDTVVFESHYGNLGYWNSQNDRAVWTIEVAKDGAYDVWLDWACDRRSAGNDFFVQCGEKMLNASVRSTGEWDHYEQRKIGTLKLAAGKHRLVVRAGEDLRGFLMDLREVRLVPKGSAAPQFGAASDVARLK